MSCDKCGLLILCITLACAHALSARAQTKASPVSPGPGIFFVATDGNDEWSGRLPQPNAGRADGPFATLTRARDAIREWKRARTQGRPTVYVRGGTYYLQEPLLLTAEDSGAAESPVTYAAYPGEDVVLSGGRPITGWKRAEGNIVTAHIPEVQSGEWYFRQLRVGDERQIQARYPNFDPQNPYTGGWLFIAEGGRRLGAFGKKVGNIHTPGDWMEWKVNVPADGDYALWLFYGAKNEPFGRTDMAERTTFSIDGGEPIPLMNLPDTGGWNVIKWSRCATLSLKAGERTLRWTNQKGGGINFDAFALCDDPQWTPQGAKLAQPAEGKRLIVVQAESFDQGNGKEMTVETAASRTQFNFKPGDLKRWPKSPEPEIHIFPAWGWVNAILQVDRIDYDSHTVYVKGGNCQQELRLGNRYYVSNVLEELDTPGEWYLDRATGMLSYWPKSPDFERAGVVAPRLDRVIDIAGDPAANEFAERIVIRGFTITDTTYSPEIPSLYLPQDAAVWLRSARNCAVEGCTFRNVGGYGVCIAGPSVENEIIGNEVVFAGQGGVLLLGRSPDAAGAAGQAAEINQPTGNLIAANTIHDSGIIYKHVAGVYVPLGKGNRITHNLIYNMPRYGVSLKTGSHENVIEYNEIHHTNLETNDTGGIETLGRDKQLTGNVIRYNLIYDTIGMKTAPDGKILRPYYTWGIYLDDYSSGTTIYGNVVYRNVLGGVHLHGGKENVIENNILVDGATAQVAYNNIRGFMEGNRFIRNIVYYTNPDAALVHGGGWTERVLSESDYNVLFHAGSDDLSGDRRVTPEGSFAQWQEKGYDEHSLVADPEFVDPKNDDYRLKPDSPALKLGFKPIPMDKIGPRGFER